MKIFLGTVGGLAFVAAITFVVSERGLGQFFAVSAVVIAGIGSNVALILAIKR